MIGFLDGRWDVAVFVDNVTDERGTRATHPLSQRPSVVKKWRSYANLSDHYDRKARFLPAVLSVLPLLPARDGEDASHQRLRARGREPDDDAGHIDLLPGEAEDLLLAPAGVVGEVARTADPALDRQTTVEVTATIVEE